MTLINLDLFIDDKEFNLRNARVETNEFNELLCFGVSRDTIKEMLSLFPHTNYYVIGKSCIEIGAALIIVYDESILISDASKEPNRIKWSYCNETL